MALGLDYEDPIRIVARGSANRPSFCVLYSEHLRPIFVVRGGEKLPVRHRVFIHETEGIV